MSEFDEATAVVASGDGRFEVNVDRRFSIGHAANGGYLMAVMLRAVLAGTTHAHPVSTSMHFLRAAGSGPAEVQVEWLKQGRTTATARATLVQGGSSAVTALVTVGTLDNAAVPDYVGHEPPPLPPVDDCVAPTPAGGAQSAFAEQVDMRLDPATAGWLNGEPSGELHMRTYFRLRDHQDPDAYVLAQAVDAMPPVVFALGSYRWAPTVELTWHMRAVPAPGWLTVLMGGRMVHDGWFDEEVEVWDGKGTLVAQSRQLARVGRS